MYRGLLNGGKIVILICLVTKVQNTCSHARWKCPKARSPEVGIKSGPCGSDTNDFSSFGEPIDISPGPFRVVFEEAVYHTGAPFRISLSTDSNDTTTSCTLLDHIPHNDNVRYPSISNPNTYIPYTITLHIPDVTCERCSLHLANPMTDKIGSDGSPNGKGCTDPNGSCASVYHSCTVPLRIHGSTPRNDFLCPHTNTTTYPPDWPTTWTGDGGDVVDATVPGLYRRESSAWSSVGFLLTTAPLRYQQDGGGLCQLGEQTNSPEVLVEKDKDEEDTYSYDMVQKEKEEEIVVAQTNGDKKRSLDSALLLLPLLYSCALSGVLA